MKTCHGGFCLNFSDTGVNQRIAVQPGKEHVDAYEDKDHHDEIHDRTDGQLLWGEPVVAVKVNERKVAAPGDEGPGLLGIPGPEASPGGLRPESAKDIDLYDQLHRGTQPRNEEGHQDALVVFQ